jgi:hypothetical protein
MRIGRVAFATLLATAACSSAAHPTTKSPSVTTHATTTMPATATKPATRTGPATTTKPATRPRPATTTKPATTGPATRGPATTGPATTGPATNSHAASVNYAAKYLDLVAPLNAALDQLRKVPPKKAVPSAVLTGIATASSNFGTAMLRVQWPGPTTDSDVRALVQANAAFSADLSQINHQNAASIAAYRNQVARDDQASASAAKKVRADLGLPPLKP